MLELTHENQFLEMEGNTLNKLNAIYPQAIEHTKMKVYEDINHYLKRRKHCHPLSNT